MKSEIFQSFDDLSEDHQNQLISEFITFKLKSTPYPNLSPKFKRGIKEADKILEQSMVKHYILIHAKSEIINALKKAKYKIEVNENV